MERRLVLVRHAKSAWDDPSLTDHERPLAPRGARALPRLSEHLGRVVPDVELVLCSTARRAVETLAGVRSSLPPEALVEVEELLYGATALGLLERVRGIDDMVRCAAVIGHNPGLQDLAISLAGAGEPDVLAQLQRKFPTAGAATISFEGDWTDLAAGSGRVETLFVPRPPRS